MNNVKEKNNGAALSTEEAAQYEVFKNGSISRETVDKWVRNDLTAIMSFLQVAWSDELVFRSIADAFYARYEKLHAKIKEDHDGRE